MGNLIKKFAIYLAAISVPILLIVLYEGFVWSQNKEDLAERELRANEQQAKQQPNQIQREKDLDAAGIARLQRARQLEARGSLLSTQQAILEEQQNNLLRCVISKTDDQCRCFDKQRDVVEVQEQRCRNLAAE